MKNLIVLILAVTISGISVFGQSTRANTPKAVISTRPLSMLFKQPNIKLEVATKNSLSFGGEATYFTGVYEGFKVDPFVRFYTSNKKTSPEGFYFQGKFSVGNHKSELTDIVDEIEDQTGNVIDTNTDERFLALGGGFGMGHQFFAGSENNFSIDLFLGLKRYKPTQNGINIDKAVFGVTRGWPTEFKFSLGYAF